MKMSDTGSSVPQDDSDEDIYKDIPAFNFEDELAELESKKETYKQEANSLSEKVQSLTAENEELKKSNETLKKNLSSLLKTAQAEVQRKDSMIEELRSQVDSFAFRRNKTITKDKYTSTDDLNPVNEKNNSKRSKSRENQINCDNIRRRGKETKEENCDNNRKSDGYRERSRSKYKNFEGSRDNDRCRDKRSSRHKTGTDYRRSYRENHRDHLKYDSYDKKRHSRSSDRNSIPRRKNSRERKRDKSTDRRRSRERSKGRNSQKRRSRSRESKGSFEKSKSRSSLDTDVVPNKEREVEVAKPKKTEKKSGTDIFSTKSPLDALYNEMVTSRHSNRLCSTKPETAVDVNETEDWTLSFKNERPNDTKFMTLYSKRMMRKLSSEAKIECKPNENNQKQNVDDEKEPGELTDDENVIESSKEFQEITKVASIESEIITKPHDESEKEVEEAKEGEVPSDNREVVEFSPFKNNYKLIRISPTKPTNTEHVLDYYSKKSAQEKNTNESETSGEKDSWKNVSSEKDETELKISTPTESPEENTKKEEDSGKLKRSKKEIQTRKRKQSENEEINCKKRKIENKRNTRSKRNSKSETEGEKETKTNEDISSFEFFKPVTNIPITPGQDYKMTTVTKLVRLETPHKCVEKLKNVTIMNVTDSPFAGTKCIEMTPRRILKNDLMLTDSEDEAPVKNNPEKEVEDKREEEEEEESENSGCESDSGASDFVDLL